MKAAPRRQGRQPRGNDPHRPAGASRLHHHHRSLHLLLREQAHLSEGTPGPDGSRRRATWKRSWATKFGDADGMPLLVAVRSGARDSMPGMMDTILNLGLNDQTVLALAKATKNERFAWDCYRRFIQMYGDVVLGVQKKRRRRSRAVRNRHPRLQARDVSRGHRRLEAHRRRPAGTRQALQGARQGTHRQSVPERSVGSAARRRRRCVRFLDERSRDRLSPQIQHPLRMGHRRERAGDGLRQHRRDLRFRRRFHAQSRPTARTNSTANS